MPTAPSCPTTLYHNSSSRSTKRPLDLDRERRDVLSFSFTAQHVYPSTPIHGIGPLSFALAYRTVFGSLPLRLVPEGNKDGSAYVQPATGGGARLPSVGRTNANDSSMQDGVGIQIAVVWCPRGAFIFSMRVCDVCGERPSERPFECTARASSRPSGVSADRLVTLDHRLRDLTAARNIVPSSAYRPQISTSDSLWDARFYGARAAPFSEETRLDDSRRKGGRGGGEDGSAADEYPSAIVEYLHDRQWSSIVLPYFLFFVIHIHTHSFLFPPSFTHRFIYHFP